MFSEKLDPEFPKIAHYQMLILYVYSNVLQGVFGEC